MTHKHDWTTINAVRVRWYNGTTRTFASLDEAVTAVGWTKIKNCSGRPLAYYDPHFTWARYDHYFGGDPVAFFDELDLRIPHFRVRDAAMQLGLHVMPYYYAGWRKLPRGKRNYVFRQGPVPHTRCRRGCRYRGSGRHMHTTQEIAENLFLDRFDEDAAAYGVRSRGNRRKGTLPTVWDERPAKRPPHRSWKGYRAHQWKAH